MHALFLRRDGCGKTRVAAIDIVAKLDGAAPVDEGSFVEEVDRHRLCQRNNASRVAGGRQWRTKKGASEVASEIDTHAAMTQRALRQVEEFVERRVVEIDVELIWH